MPEALQIDSNLVLKPISVNDEQIIFDAVKNNNKFFQKFDSFIADKDPKEYVKNILVRATIAHKERSGLFFGLWLHDEFCGMFNVNEIDWKEQKGDVGYWLTEGHTGQGLATKTLKVLIGYCFNELKLKQLSASTATTNVASISLLERLGFVNVMIKKNACVVKGKPVDDFVFHKFL